MKNIFKIVKSIDKNYLNDILEMTLREKTTYGVRNNVTTWINSILSGTTR